MNTDEKMILIRILDNFGECGSANCDSCPLDCSENDNHSGKSYKDVLEDRYKQALALKAEI